MTAMVEARKSGQSTVAARSLVLCACLAQVTVVLDTTIIAVALPAAQTDLGFVDSERQWGITAYTLAFGSLLLIGGRLSQLLGPRRAFILGLAGFGFASLLGGFADSVGMLLAARAAQGVFAALLAPTNLSLMNMAFPDRESRARAFAIFGSVAGAGAAIGLILGGVLTEGLSWRWCLFVNVPLTFLTAAIALRVLKGVPGPTRSSVTGDLLGLGLGSVGVFALVLGFSRAEELGWSSATVLSLLASGFVLLVLFIIREMFAEDPVLPLGIIANGVRASSYLSIAMVGFAQMGASLYLTFYFQQNRGYSALQAGFVFLPMVGGLVLAALVSTRFLVPRFGLRMVYPTGALVTAAGFLWLTTIGYDSDYVSTVLGPVVLVGLGLGLVMAPAMSSATHGIGPDNSGLASAVANTSQQLGASLGVAFLSTFAAQHGARYFTDHADSLSQQVSSTLAASDVLPTSPEGIALAASIAAEFESAAEVSAYAAGFGVLTIMGITVALALVVILTATRSGRGSE